MGDGNLFASALARGYKPSGGMKETEEKKISGSGNGSIDIGKHLIIGPPPDKGSDKQSITELAMSAFKKAKAEVSPIAELTQQGFDRLKKAGDGKYTYEAHGARRNVAQEISQKAFERQLDEWASKNQHLGPVKVKEMIDDFRNATAGISANGNDITKEQQIVSYATDQLLNQFRQEEVLHQREENAKEMTAERAFEQSGRFGDPFA